MNMETRIQTNDVMSIRDMCDAYGVTPRTLRFYEQKELLFPTREGQKRLYGKSDRARLKLILQGKRFGFPLEEIRQLLALYDRGDNQLAQLERTYEVALRHLAEMKSQRAALDDAIDDLQNQIDWGTDMLSQLRKESD